MFDIKYLLSNRQIASGNEIYTLKDVSGSEYLYENNYVLPLGFMLPSDFNSIWDSSEDANPFNIQNSLAQSAAGIDNLFTRLSFEDNNSSAIITVTEDTYLYAYIMNKSISTITVTIDGTSESFTGVNHGRMIDIGFVSAGSVINVTGNDSSQSLQMYAYSMDINKFKQLYSRLSDEGLEVTSYDSTHINGVITAQNDGLMYTSIPYDEGYTVYVDGVKTSYTSIGDKAFIALNLSKGTHNIEFRYYPRGLKGGRIIWVISLIILAALIAFRIKYKKELSQPGALAYLKERKEIEKK